MIFVQKWEKIYLWKIVFLCLVLKEMQVGKFLFILGNCIILTWVWRWRNWLSLLTLFSFTWRQPPIIGSRAQNLESKPSVPNQYLLSAFHQKTFLLSIDAEAFSTLLTWNLHYPMRIRVLMAGLRARSILVGLTDPNVGMTYLLVGFIWGKNRWAARVFQINVHSVHRVVTSTVWSYISEWRVSYLLMVTWNDLPCLCFVDPVVMGYSSFMHYHFGLEILFPSKCIWFV